MKNKRRIASRISMSLVMFTIIFAAIWGFAFSCQSDMSINAETSEPLNMSELIQMNSEPVSAAVETGVYNWRTVWSGNESISGFTDYLDTTLHGEYEFKTYNKPISEIYDDEVSKVRIVLAAEPEMAQYPVEVVLTSNFQDFFPSAPDCWSPAAKFENGQITFGVYPEVPDVDFVVREIDVYVLTGGNVSYDVNVPLYTKDGERIFEVKGAGLLATEDGDLVYNPEDSSATIHDAETGNFLYGANQTLAIYLDSRLERHYLKAGMNYVKSITENDPVYLINFNLGNGKTKPIYTFREEVKKDWWYWLVLDFQTEYRFHDINGQLIENEHIAKMEFAWWKVFFTTSLIDAINTGGDSLWYPVVEILEKTTLAELTEYMSFATENPWDTLEGADGWQVITSDGREIYINPRNNQLTDFFGWALYNAQTGLPIILKDNDIITAKKHEQQPISEGILLDSITINALLNSGQEFYMSTVTDDSIIYDIPVTAKSELDAEKGIFWLMNGKSAQDVIDETYGATVLDGQTWQEFVEECKKFLNGVGNWFATNWWIVLLIVAGIVLIILAPTILPLLVWLLKMVWAGISAPFRMVSRWIKK